MATMAAQSGPRAGSCRAAGAWHACAPSAPVEASDRTRRDDGRPLAVGGDGLLTPRPLGPVFDIGSQLGGELADLCHRGAERDRLFAAFLAELDTPAAFTVAVMEDVHWADEATIDLLSFLGR